MTIPAQACSNENETSAKARPAIRWALASGLRLGCVVVGLAAWFWTQSLIGARPSSELLIGDRVHDWTASVHAFLYDNRHWAHAVLIVGSALIDLLGVFLLVWSILGPSIRPFLGLLLLFAMRQICQAICTVPPPPGMIWEDPGFPSLLVTYGVANDLFFSGHTALAVYGAVELARLGRSWLVLAVFTAAYEIASVLLLRAHYTMDVFAGIVAALLVAGVAARLAPSIDRALGRVFVG